MWNTFLTSNTTGMRILRTVVQGILSVIVTNIDLLVGVDVIPTTYRPVVTMAIMAILSPIMSEIGKHISDPTELIVEAEEAVGAITKAATIADDAEETEDTEVTEDTEDTVVEE